MSLQFAILGTLSYNHEHIHILLKVIRSMHPFLELIVVFIVVTPTIPIRLTNAALGQILRVKRCPHLHQSQLGRFRWSRPRPSGD